MSRTLPRNFRASLDIGATGELVLINGSVAASLRRAGRKTTARTYDAMIAAVAVANDLPVYTCNPTDFNGIDGLEVVAVPVPDAPSAPSALEQTAHDTAHDPENPQQPS